MKVLIVGNLFKFPFLKKMIEYLPDEVECKLVPISSCSHQPRTKKASSFRKRYAIIPKGEGYSFSRSPYRIMRTKIETNWRDPISYFTRRPIFIALRDFKPDLCLSDVAGHPIWFIRLHELLYQAKMPVLIHLRGDWWTEQRYAVYFALNEKRKLLSKLRTALAFSYSKFLTSRSLRMAKTIIPICRWLEGAVKEHLGNLNTCVIHQGIDPEMWINEGMESEKPNVAIIQDFNIYPKVVGLVEFSRVIRKMNRLKFHICGGGEYLPFARKYLDRLPNVTIHGSVPYPAGVREVLSNAWVYVLASGLDCCPTTVLEASLMNKPVVASNVGGVPEIVLEGRTGYLVANHDVDGWMERLSYLVENEDERKKMGENGREFVKKNFSWTVISPKFHSAFKRALED
jgi:glycosyltransferase involved in cell wall biosynthesis